MTVISKTLVFRFIDTSSSVLLELTNTTEKTLKSIEIMTERQYILYIARS
jgi:hypothetical protein